MGMALTSATYFQNILVYTSFIPLIGILLLLFVNPEQRKLSKIIALNFSAFPFLIFVVIWGGFKKSIGTFQFVTKILWVPVLNLNVTLGIDGISLFFLLLTTLLIPLCILISWNSVQFNLKEYLIAFLAIEFFLIGVFCVLDVLMFYIFFESVLIFFSIYTFRFCANVNFNSVHLQSSWYHRLRNSFNFCIFRFRTKIAVVHFFPSIRIKSTYDACSFMVA